MEEKTIKNKKGFFKNLIKSIKNFDEYEDFALEGAKESFKYFFKLLLIFCILASIAISYVMIKTVNIAYMDFKELVPDFSFVGEECILDIDSDEETKIDKYNPFIGTIIINTSEDIDTEKIIEQNEDKEQLIIFRKEGMTIYSKNSSAYNKSYYKYEDLLSNYNIKYRTKAEMVTSMEKSKIIICLVIYVTVVFIIFFAYFIEFMSYILILTIVTLIISTISKMKLSISNAFGIGVHALTLPIVLQLIYIILKMVFGIEIKYFDWMYNTIAYIYIIVAILMIKTDHINRQIEVAKIIEKEEKKEDKKEEDNKEEEEKDKEKEKKKKEDKKEKEDNNSEDDESLNGSEA